MSKLSFLKRMEAWIVRFWSVGYRTTFGKRFCFLFLVSCLFCFVFPFCFLSEGAEGLNESIQSQRIQNFNENGQKIEVLRAKGVFSLLGETKRHILQGFRFHLFCFFFFCFFSFSLTDGCPILAVHELYDLTPTTEWEQNEAKICRILFVGLFPLCS